MEMESAMLFGTDLSGFTPEVVAIMQAFCRATESNDSEALFSVECDNFYASLNAWAEAQTEGKDDDVVDSVYNQYYAAEMAVGM